MARAQVTPHTHQYNTTSHDPPGSHGTRLHHGTEMQLHTPRDPHPQDSPCDHWSLGPPQGLEFPGRVTTMVTPRGSPGRVAPAPAHPLGLARAEGLVREIPVLSHQLSMGVWPHHPTRGPASRGTQDGAVASGGQELWVHSCLPRFSHT